MRVGVYGGSFNPPHVGHAMVASWLRWTDQVDEVWLVPAREHAFGKELAPWEARLELCQALATTLGPWARVDAIEGERGGPSYTVDTLRALSARHPGHTFRLVVGSDNLEAAPRWRAWDEIVRAWPPIVAGRVGSPVVDGVPSFPDVSSTLVRARMGRGEDVSALVPASVLDVARRLGLYAGVPQ
jgi:nicotinate-nucleotide adenylyltransferase